MKDIQQFIFEGKDEKFFNSVKSILEKDKISKTIIKRTNVYDDNKGRTSQVPFILLKEGEEYNWYTLQMIDEEMDFAAPKDMVGIYINRMFYPISDKELLLEIVKKYNEQ